MRQDVAWPTITVWLAYIDISREISVLGTIWPCLMGALDGCMLLIVDVCLFICFCMFLGFGGGTERCVQCSLSLSLWHFPFLITDFYSYISESVGGGGGGGAVV